jgi:AraC-like DNA-binding protein
MRCIQETSSSPRRTSHSHEGSAAALRNSSSRLIARSCPRCHSSTGRLSHPSETGVLTTSMHGHLPESPTGPHEPTGPFQLTSALLNLIAVLAAGDGTAPVTAHRVDARSYIEEHLTALRLGAEQVAAAIGIGERQLSRVFAADGISIPRHILSRRLHLAYSMLSSAAAAGKAATRGRHRCPVRLYVGHVLLPCLPPALRLPCQRHPRSTSNLTAALGEIPKGNR